MDNGDWRYGQEGDDRPWTEPVADSAPAPDLWADHDEEADNWTSTTAWRPRHQADSAGTSPISPTPVGPTSPVSGNGYGGSYSSGGYPIPGYSTGYTGPPRYGVTSARSWSPAGSGSVASAADTAPVSSAGLALSDPRPQLSRSERSDSGSASPNYLRVLWLTAAWYGGALVVYLLWLVLAGGDREAVAGRALVDGLPWMFAATLISAGLAAALRRVTVGWGAIGVSFAAAVIGAGLATITHSFA